MAPFQLVSHSRASPCTRQMNRGRFIPTCRHISLPATPALFPALRSRSTLTQVVLILALHPPACSPDSASPTIKGVAPHLSQITWEHSTSPTSASCRPISNRLFPPNPCNTQCRPMGLVLGEARSALFTSHSLRDLKCSRPILTIPALEVCQPLHRALLPSTLLPCRQETRTRTLLLREVALPSGSTNHNVETLGALVPCHLLYRTSVHRRFPRVEA